MLSENGAFGSIPLHLSQHQTNTLDSFPIQGLGQFDPLYFNALDGLNGRIKLSWHCPADRFNILTEAPNTDDKMVPASSFFPKMKLSQRVPDEDAGSDVNKTRQQNERRQLYLCSPKSCRPRVQRRGPASPLRWRRSERLPCLSTITPEALRTRLHSARCPRPRSGPAAPGTPGGRRERGHKKERRRLPAMSDCEI